MADIIPHNVMALMAEGAIDLENDTLYVDLIDDTYSPNADDDTFETGSDPYDSMISTANGYTQGTHTATLTVTDEDGDDNAKVDMNDWSVTASGGSIGPARYAVLWDDTAANDPIIYIFDLGENKTAGDGTDFKITIDANGLFTMAQA